ncbi:hypothetical protein [Sediminitomix flava]|uniref:Outer membrane protein with glycine zipper n=1 Tax=Sediminitomix flava TaxID=379075 RepID=A0A315Z0J0_SEDFL|nr:hypothetical protein [Sediminitomix flava]PWJ36153.1 hypothetical protein BC781_109172 [Sediminitomix flava]
MASSKLLTLALLFTATSFFSSCSKKNTDDVNDTDAPLTEETQQEQAKENPTEVAKPSPDKQKPQTSKPKPVPVVKEEVKKQQPAAKKEPKPEPPKPVIMTVDAGKDFNISLSEDLDTKSLQVDQSFKAALTSPIIVNGKEVLPKNATVTGKVVAVQNEKKMGGRSKLEVTLSQVYLDGASYNLKTNTIPFQGKSQTGKTARNTGAGAAVGAGIGAAVGKKGDKGKAAGIGAAIGAALGAGATAIGEKGSLVLEQGTTMTFNLERSVNIELPPVK